MELKIIRARTMSAAIEAVKKTLGPGAVIVRTRSYKTGGILGIGAKPVVEVTATCDHAAKAPPRAQEPRKQAAKPPQTPRPEESLDDLLRALAQRGGNDRQTRQAPPPADAANAVPAQQAVKPSPVVRAPVEPSPVTPAEVLVTRRSGTPDAPKPTIEDELASIKRMMGQVLSATRSGPSSLPAVGHTTDAVTHHYLKLLEHEVSAEIADCLIGEVRDDLDAAELADHAVVRQSVLNRLAALAPCANDAPKDAGRPGSPFVMALVGPTGVGKTTTIAKLAATYKMRYGKRVGLITTDTYRIGAVDQLRTYANIVGIPLHVAMSVEDVESAMAAMSDREVILIDTAGRSPRDTDRIDELARFLARAKPDQVHLVLSAAAGQSAMLSAGMEFKRLRPDRVIFTKLDEAVNFGVLIAAAKQLETRLSYITNGQEVPDHIEPCRPDRLARLVLDGVPRT